MQGSCRSTLIFYPEPSAIAEKIPSHLLQMCRRIIPPHLIVAAVCHIIEGNIIIIISHHQLCGSLSGQQDHRVALTDEIQRLLQRAACQIQGPEYMEPASDLPDR